MLRLLAITLLLAGCTGPVEMKAEELRQLEPREGRVFGSILVVVAPLEEGSSWLEGRKASELDYRFRLERVKDAYLGLELADTARTISVEPGVETAFALKLDEGGYSFSRLEQEGLSDLQMDVNAGFAVTRGRTDYIGRLVVELPARTSLFARREIRIEDAQDAAAALLGKDYEPVLAGATRALMVPPLGR